MKITPRALGLSLLFPAILMIFWLVRLETGNWKAEQKRPVYASTGYRDVVNAMITAKDARGERWLDLVPASANAGAREGERPGDIHLTDAAPQVARDYYKRSYLKKDVEAYNRGERDRFVVQNNQIVAVNPYLHSIPLPFADLPVWGGDLTYRPSNTRHREIRIAGKGALPISPLASGVPNNPYAAPLALPLPERLTASRMKGQTETAPPRWPEVYKLYRGAVSTKNYMGEIHGIGDELLFCRDNQGGGVSATINGRKVGDGDLFALRLGDHLKLEWDNGGKAFSETMHVAVSEKAPLISRYRWVRRGKERVPEKPDPPFAADLAQAVTNALGQSRELSGPGGPPAPGARNFDLSLSLDKEIHENTQRVLEEFCDKRLSGKHEFRACITVMDALSGEILALASYPTRNQFPEDPRSGSSEEDDLRARLLRNHNFQRLPVGSVAKIPFTASILAASPFLQNLLVPGKPSGVFTSILGIPLSKPITAHKESPAAADLETFIQKSLNSYALTLLTLSTGVSPTGFRAVPPDRRQPTAIAPQGERFFMRGPNGATAHAFRPYLEPFVFAGAGSMPQIQNLDGRNVLFAAKMKELFGVDVTYVTNRSSESARRPWQGDDWTDTAPWRPLLDLVYGRDRTPPGHPFFGISPERENLALNFVHDYRTDFLTLILGGGSSLWTAPKLCEIWSRLVTGRMVEARLVHAIKTPSEVPLGYPEEPDLLPMDRAVRRRLVMAMTRPATPDGTASQLNALLTQLAAAYERDKGQVLGFFCKTGSPNNERPVYTRLAHVMIALIKARVLDYDGASGAIRYRGRPVPDPGGEGEGPGEFDSLVRLMEESDRAILGGAPASHVLHLCADFNAGGEKRLKSPFVVRHGVLTEFRQKTTARFDSDGAAFVFTMGLFPRACQAGAFGGLPLVDVTRGRPSRAITVAINVEGQGPSYEVSVPLAEQLIREVINGAIQNGW